MRIFNRFNDDCGDLHANIPSISHYHSHSFEKGKIFIQTQT